MSILKSKFALGILAIVVVAGAAIPFLLNRSGPEPVFYGRALFGPDASDDSAIVHFIVRGKEIFVDGNKDDIPQPEELNVDKRLPKMDDPDCGMAYTAHELRLAIAPESVTEKLPQQLAMTVDVEGDFSFQQLGTIVLSPDPAQSNWVHFNGPINFVFSESDLAFNKGGGPMEVRLLAGTITAGSREELGKSQADPDSPPAGPVSLNRIAFVIPAPAVTAPNVQITFETDDQPIVQDIRLDTFC